eukprot:1188568-Amphidinium_carterae.1
MMTYVKIWWFRSEIDNCNVPKFQFDRPRREYCDKRYTLQQRQNDQTCPEGIGPMLATPEMLHKRDLQQFQRFSSYHKKPKKTSPNS